MAVSGAGETQRPEYTEEPRVTHHANDYEELCSNELLKVTMIEGKGKGVVAATMFKKDDEVVRENALACAQNMDDLKEGLRVCAMTLRSLETPKETLVRASPNMKGVELPRIAEAFPELSYVRCENAEKGCQQCYISDAMRIAAQHRFHNSLCYGLMDDKQRAAYDEFLSETWIQGGIDYSDTFHLGMHVMAIMFSSMKLGESVEEAAAPFEALISVPFERFVFTYLLDEEDAKDEGEDATRTKEETLAKAMRLLRVVFAVDEDHPLLTQYRFTRLLGAILLNGQERRPTSPWMQYVAWLRENAGKTDYKSMKAIAKNNSKLQYSTRGQVTYCDDNDETLLVHAIRDIKKGEELCISYIDEDADFQVRQEQLRDHYLFTCICPKCNADAARRAEEKKEEESK